MRKKKQDDRLLKQLSLAERRYQQLLRNRITAEVVASKGTLIYF